MLSRLAACFISLGLLGNAAGAHEFAQAPEAARVAMPVSIERIAPDREQVRKALEKRRAKNLASFRAYRKGGVYPHNTFRFGPLNVWKDSDGHLCAAATMIAKDGRRELVDDVAKTNNQIRLMNVTDGVLLDWLMTSGFTIEEIDRIQEPMIYPDGRIDGGLPRDFTAEDGKLRADYARTDAWLVKHAKRSLDKATERLMKNPDLARRLFDGTV